MSEENFGKGAKKDKKDERDRIYESLGSSLITPEEWEKGYDIEKIIGEKLPIKNQFKSYSCIGQAFSYYSGVLNALEIGHYDEISAKGFYSLITLGYNKGAYLRDGAKLSVDFGAILEQFLRSYKNDGTTDESFMIDKSWKTPEMEKMAQILKSKHYYLVTGMGIDTFARAIRDGFGMVAGVEGVNNGTWSGYEPKPPKEGDPTWGHGLFFGKFGIDEKGKFISTPNSWGERYPNPDYADGWQKLREDYFINNNRFVFNPWVLIDQKNIMAGNTNAKIIKDKNSSSVGIWLPFLSEAAMKSLCLNFGIEVPELNNEEDWNNFIQGELTLK